MVHIIPLSVAQRRLDTGNVVSYPEGSPVGRAMQGFGDELSAVAEHYRQMKERQEAFDAELARRGFNGQVAQAEDEAAAKAPADGSGLHDAMYGQVDPRTGRVVKAGLFDTLFDNALPNMPESQRANFARQKEALRAAGSLRMAQRQLQRRDDYEMAEWTKVDNMSTSAIAKSDPNDAANFEAIRQSGFDLIAKIGNPLARQVAEAAWRTNTAKALVQAVIAQDPKRAAEMLGAVPVARSAVDAVVDKIIGVESGGNAAAKNPNSSASGVGQFLDSTWVQIVRAHRPDLAAGKSAADIIALKGDAALGREMTAALARDNAEYLTNRGVPVTEGNLYLAHFLGSAGAVNVLEADPNASIASVVGQDVVRANPFLADKIVAETRAWSEEKMGASARGDRVGKLTPDETGDKAFGGKSVSPVDLTNSIPLEALTYLKPDDVVALKAQANIATAAQMVDARAKVHLAEQNAPAVIAATGKYPEQEPAPGDFVSIYGAEEGAKHFEQFRTTVDVARAFHEMYRAPNQAIHADLRDLEPGPDSTAEQRERYEIKAGAARLIMNARDADPVGYVTQIFPGLAPDWSKVSTPEDFQRAVTWARAAQHENGFSRVLAVPQILADKLGGNYVDESVPLQQRIIELSDILKTVRDPEARFALAGQVFQFALAHLREKAASDPKLMPEELGAREKTLEADLLEMAQHPARVRYNAGSWWQKPFAAANDSARLFANSATFDQADRLSAGMNSIFSDKSYAELLAAEQAESEDAADRAGYAAIPIQLLGAFATGHGFQGAGVTFTGRFAAESAKGLSGLLARSATMAADGAAFGGVDAALNGRDIVREMGTGALLGAGGNALAEGLTAVGGQVVRRLTRREAGSGTSAAEGRGGASEGNDLDQGVDSSKPAPELDSENSNASATHSPTGQFYSVVFEVRLAPTSYPGVSRQRHNQEANEALLQAMEGDTAFAQAMQNHGINLRRTPTGLAPRKAPKDFSWHHGDEPGVMQLVPRYQHDSGTIFQKVLHPNRGGGFSLWGK